jgi:hypothetical protein
MSQDRVNEDASIVLDITSEVEVERRGRWLQIYMRALSVGLSWSILAEWNGSDKNSGLRTTSSGLNIGLEWKLLLKNPIHMKVVFLAMEGFVALMMLAAWSLPCACDQ